MQVVQCIEPRAENFTAFGQVIKIGAAIVFTGVAAARFVNRPRISAEPGIAQSQIPSCRVDIIIARITRGQNAVEHINAPRDRCDDILGFADTHQIAGAVIGQKRDGILQHLIAQAFLLTDGEAANRISGKSDSDQCLARGLA